MLPNIRVLLKFLLILGQCGAFALNFAEFVESSGIQLRPEMPVLSSSPETICRYCLCDRQTATVICSSKHMFMKIITLPEWAETFYAHNLTTLVELPHFTYHGKLRILRINHCQLRYVHPLALVSLPQLETIHLANNLLESIPENFLKRSTRLRILNLAGNRFQDLDEIEWSLPNGLILEELILNDNPLELSSASQNKEFPWPQTHQLHLKNTGIQAITKNAIIFKESQTCNYSVDCRSLHLNEAHWKSLQLLDLSANPQMDVNPTVLTNFLNITTLKLAKAHRIPEEFLEWLANPNVVCKHLDLRGARIFINPITKSINQGYANVEDFAHVKLNEWTHCTNLEWLDISGIGLERLELPESCHLKWLYANDNSISVVQINNKNLETLQLNNNRLRVWPLGIHASVEFSQNNIDQTGSYFEAPLNTLNYQHLTTLSLSNNLIEKIPTNWHMTLPNLQQLDLAVNRIHSMDFNFALSDYIPEPNLKFLNLSQNFIQNFSNFLQLPQLIILDLSHNGLQYLSSDFFDQFPSLQHLHLAENPGLHLDGWLPESKPKSNNILSTIDLSYCRLQHQPELSNFERLKQINLNGNQIRSMDGLKLPICSMEIQLVQNQIHSIGNMSQTQSQCLKELELARNPLLCECSLLDFSNILKQQANFYDRSEYYCFLDDWQHPLKAYMESNIEQCEVELAKSIGNGQLFNIAYKFTLILIFLIFLIFLIVFIITKFSTSYENRHTFSTIIHHYLTFSTYKPVPNFDPPVDL